MQAIPSFLFTPQDVKTFVGLYLGVNPFRAPPGAMALAENLILRSQGVLEPRRGYKQGAASPIPINVFGYKADQKRLIAAAYDSPALPTDLPVALGHRSRFAVYDWQADAWTQAVMWPGALPYDRPSTGVVPRFATANKAMYLQGRYGLLKVEDATTPISTTNLIQESVRLGHSPWAATSATVTEFFTAAPDGNVAAARLTCSAGAAQHFLSHAISYASGANYCASLFAIAGTVSFLTLDDGAGNWCIFNLSTGVVVQSNGKAVGTMHPLRSAPGWYRCLIDFPASSGPYLRVAWADTQAHAAPGTSWTAAGTETVTVYGAQVEGLGLYSPAPLVQTTAGAANTATLASVRPAMLVKPWSQPLGSGWAGNKPALSASGSWLANGFQTAYRLTVARRGANRELIESEPSERIIVVNQSGSAQAVAWTFDAHPLYPRDAFLRLWRAQQVAVNTDPGDEMFLVAEIPLPTLTPLGRDGFIETAIASGGSYTDLTPDTALFVPLYTNPQTGEGTGLLASNNTAPLARDMAFFKTRMYYCGTRDVHRLIIKVIGTGSNGVSVGSTITVDGVTFTFASSDAAALAPQVFTGGTVAQNLENTARALVAHINNYFAGRTGGFTGDARSVVYASYIAVSSGGAGQILLQRLVPGCEPIRVQTSSRAGWDKDYTALTLSDDSAQTAGLGWSKIAQPESVPIPNNAIVGDASMDALRVIALHDTLFLFKRDGLWTVTDDGSGPNVQLLDPTVKLIAPETAVAIDNVIIALTESGVILVSEGSGAINISDDQIGRPLRRLVLYVGQQTLSQVAYGAAYQGQRQYVLALPESPTATTATLYYVYNLQTQAWTTATLPVPTDYGIAQFDQSVLYFAGPQRLGDAFRGFLVERSSGGNVDYQDLGGILRSPTTGSTNTLIFPGNLTLPVYANPNFIADSQDRFAGASWARGNATATDNVTSRGVAPDGGPAVSVLADNATNGPHYLNQLLTMETGQTYTLSMHLKAGTLGFASISLDGGAYAVFNVSAGTVLATNQCSAAAVSLGNGWYRCSITFVFSASANTTFSAATANANINFFLNLGTTQAQATPGTSYVGVGNDLLVWGAQVERNAATTPYIATPLRPQPIVPGDVFQQFQATKAIIQTVASVSYNSATGQTTVVLDATPPVAWTTDDIVVSKAIRSRILMLPQHVDHPLTAKVWREAYLSFRYIDLDSMQIDWNSEAFQYATDNPVTEIVAAPGVDAAPIIVLPFANAAGPFAQYVWGRQTRDVILKATLHHEAVTSAQLTLGIYLGQAQRRFELSGFDVTMSGKTERPVR